MAKNEATVLDYLSIARFDHSIKHIFIIPGILLALLLRGVRSDSLVLHVLLGLITLVCIASANYVINEYLDRDFDKHHPEKSKRTAVQADLKWQIIWLMFLTAIVFALQGIVYNVPPIRSKDKLYLDVISESINNPIRLMIGWLMIDPTSLPPTSVVLSYYLGGAFLMGSKRLSEYRDISASHGKELLIRYRASFLGYSELRLVVSCFVYAMLSSFFLAIFLIKYRIEYIIMIPWIILLFGYYLALAMKEGRSATQKPEKLYKESVLMMMVVVLGVLFTVATFIDMPSLDLLSQQRFIELK